MSNTSFAAALRAVMDPDTVERVSQLLAVSARTVWSWSRGERVTSPDGVFALEEALEVPPGWLSRHLGYVPAGDEIVEAAAEQVAALAADELGEYRIGLGRVAVDLLDRVDLGRAARRGLQLELMRLAVEDFEAKQGGLSDAEVAAASRELGLTGSHAPDPHTAS